MIKTEDRKYRSDIDGLRAIAVIAVIIYHFGHLPNGYLGVDLFFVISGYLITGIIYRQSVDNRFSIKDFYIRRTRRIIPLVTFITAVSLVLGIIVMLPDDLENLSQSIVATSFFSNNILQAVTTRNYWDVVNEFKPLMHTWSLGVEEQYYLVYPFLFLIFRNKRIKYILPALIVLTILSLVLFFSPFPDFKKFYYLPFRFFELSIGGILAVVLGQRIIHHRFSLVFILLIIAIFFFDFAFLPENLLIFITILLSTGILISYNRDSKISAFILENPVMVFIGRISFSLYMWHQVLLAFGRYFVFEELTLKLMIIIFILTILLSVFTYYVIEQPFRNRHKISMRTLILSLGIVFITTNAISMYIYFKAGVLQDIPELNISKENVSRNMHAQYNARIHNYNKDFSSEGNYKVLVIGNSFGRDWANVLLESKFAPEIELSYIYDEFNYKENVEKRSAKADIIFYSTPGSDALEQLELPVEKLWCIGTKNFGINNGLFYNYSGEDYCEQRTTMAAGIIEWNDTLRMTWGERFIDLIDMVADENNKVPVFTPDCKFISQDCRHLTQAGAQFYAGIINGKKDFILNKVELND